MDLPVSVDLHAIYIALMLLALLLTITNPVTRHFPDKSSRRRYYTLQAITAISAVFGAKLAVLMGDALWPLQGFTHWEALLSSGRSIAGALLFGFLGAEAAKPPEAPLGVRSTPNAPGFVVGQVDTAVDEVHRRPLGRSHVDHEPVVAVVDQRGDDDLVDRFEGDGVGG